MSRCKDCFYFEKNNTEESGICNKKEKEVYKGNRKCELYENKKWKSMTTDEFWIEMEKWTNEKVNRYIIYFSEHDSIQIDIVQDINRPNNPTDDEIIEEYIENNYGYVKYEIINFDTMEQVRL
ncbi:hypothetical protein KGF41_14160 [Clostridioides sp. ZZV14-6150]|uniref:hypothetical protein n=1 Tax=Clostridioides sp. ZZV14-6150 TaxID=2811493 RepID=UPI001D10CCDE|nr:hypothetical protein [Clostridioides sp. ZZV14-6150]